MQEWAASIGLDPAKFGMHSLRRPKAVLFYRRTGNLRAVQLLLGHSKIKSTGRYFGIEVDGDGRDRREDRYLIRKEGSPEKLRPFCGA
jgi:integrase